MATATSNACRLSLSLLLVAISAEGVLRQRRDAQPKDEVLRIHNNFRRQAGASNMAHVVRSSHVYHYQVLLIFVKSWSDTLAYQASKLVTQCKWTAARNHSAILALDSPFPSQGTVLSLVQNVQTFSINATLMNWFATGAAYSVDRNLCMSSDTDCLPYIQASFP
jgi:hypothetical protein